MTGKLELPLTKLCDITNSFALMLPLSFNRVGKIDCALVTVRNKGGAYEGKTILSIGMAYSNARILRKPDAHWMTQCIDDNEMSSCNLAKPNGCAGVIAHK